MARMATAAAMMPGSMCNSGWKGPASPNRPAAATAAVAVAVSLPVLKANLIGCIRVDALPIMLPSAALSTSQCPGSTMSPMSSTPSWTVIVFRLFLMRKVSATRLARPRTTVTATMLSHGASARWPCATRLQEAQARHRTPETDDETDGQFQPPVGLVGACASHPAVLGTQWDRSVAVSLGDAPWS